MSGVLRGLCIVQNAITQSQESSLFNFYDKLLKRKKYEGNHWDDVIRNYKELEVSALPVEASEVVQEVQTLLTKLINPTKPLVWLPTHVIDLHQNGHIGPHVDSIKFSGDIVAVLSLLSPRILRLAPAPDTSSDGNVSVKENQYSRSFEFYMPPRSLYVMTGALRYHYTHEILGTDLPSRMLEPVATQRRLSLVIRDAHPNDMHGDNESRQRY